MKRLLMTMVVLAAGLGAASIDGKWTAEFSAPARKADAAAAAAQPQKVEVTLDLKSAGADLTGSVSMGKGRRGRENPIQDGKIDGDKFSFTTIQKGKNGEVKMKWSGTVKGDELTGERAREGAKRGASFTAKRAG